MITIKNKLAIQKMHAAGQKIANILYNINDLIKPGVSTLELDAWIAQQLTDAGMVSKSKGYKGYQHVSCISVNDEVVHGIPRKNRVLQAEDLVKIDICASLKGYSADAARCYVVKSSRQEIDDFIAVAQRALDKGILAACPGNHVGDISAAIQTEVERHGYGIIRDFAGHGIGKEMHEEPEILNVGKAGSGPVLRAGMTLALEPMITMGNYAIYVDNDGWTVKTKDKSLAAHIEDTIVITNDGAHVLTRNTKQVGVNQ